MLLGASRGLNEGNATPGGTTQRGEAWRAVELQQRRKSENRADRCTLMELSTAAHCSMSSYLQLLIAPDLRVF